MAEETKNTESQEEAPKAEKKTTEDQTESE